MPFVKLEIGDLEYKPMAGAKLKEARLAFGMPRLEFGYLLGMTGRPDNIKDTIRRYETGIRDISPMCERLVLMLLWHKSDFGYLPDLDSGERVPTKTPVDFTKDSAA